MPGETLGAEGVTYPSGLVPQDLAEPQRQRDPGAFAASHSGAERAHYDEFVIRECFLARGDRQAGVR
jgi:hypothetical protein